MAIQAIETSYAGCRFRSRLEARWAVFFDELDLDWRYEVDAYQLPSGAYLPDFWLPNVHVENVAQPGTWFEVKAGTAAAGPDDPRWAGLVRHTRQPIIVAFDMPRPDRELVWGFTGGHDGYMVAYWLSTDNDCWHPHWDNGRAFCACPSCGLIGVTFEGRLERLACNHHLTERYADESRFRHAYTIARSTRFDRAGWRME